MPPILESDPLDSWDVEEEPVSTPDDDVSVKIGIRVMFSANNFVFNQNFNNQS